MGYKKAGDILVAQALNNVVDRRNIIYVALFCYRQSVELYLKKIIVEFGDDSLGKLTHDLESLWLTFLQTCSSRIETKTDEFDVIESIVMELHTADKQSDGFRYPTTRNGAEFGFGDRVVDLEHMQDVMQAVENFFEAVDMHLSN
jgi:HEPN domain-containing protein